MSQPHVPGDPTYTAIEHTLSSSSELVGTNISHSGSSPVPVGLFMPDARMEGTMSKAAAAAYSIRLANEDVGWVLLAGEGAVNVIGHIQVKTDDSAANAMA